MLNKVILQGRLTKNPEMKITSSGVSVAKTTIAVDRSYVKQGEERKTDFINVTAFSKTADFFGKYFKKGQMALIVGKIQTDSFDSQEGKKIYTTDIIIDEISFCEKKRDSEENTESDTLQDAARYIDGFDDELPY